MRSQSRTEDFHANIDCGRMKKDYSKDFTQTIAAEDEDHAFANKVAAEMNEHFDVWMQKQREAASTPSSSSTSRPMGGAGKTTENIRVPAPAAPTALQPDAQEAVGKRPPLLAQQDIMSTITMEDGIAGLNLSPAEAAANQNYPQNVNKEQFCCEALLRCFDCGLWKFLCVKMNDKRLKTLAAYKEQVRRGKGTAENSRDHRDHRCEAVGAQNYYARHRREDHDQHEPRLRRGSTSVLPSDVSTSLAQGQETFYPLNSGRPAAAAPPSRPWSALSFSAPAPVGALVSPRRSHLFQNESGAARMRRSEVLGPEQQQDPHRTRSLGTNSVLDEDRDDDHDQELQSFPPMKRFELKTINGVVSAYTTADGEPLAPWVSGLFFTENGKENKPRRENNAEAARALKQKLLGDETGPGATTSTGRAHEAKTSNQSSSEKRKEEDKLDSGQIELDLESSQAKRETASYFSSTTTPTGNKQVLRQQKSLRRPDVRRTDLFLFQDEDINTVAEKSGVNISARYAPEDQQRAGFSSPEPLPSKEIFEKTVPATCSSSSSDLYRGDGHKNKHPPSQQEQEKEAVFAGLDGMPRIRFTFDDACLQQMAEAASCRGGGAGGPSSVMTSLEARRSMKFLLPTKQDFLSSESRNSIEPGPASTSAKPEGTSTGSSVSLLSGHATCNDHAFGRSVAKKICGMGQIVGTTVRMDDDFSASILKLMDECPSEQADEGCFSCT
ncbi:unnamed protein product [Amoebophrya sp. A120]|nr:unnamed protein product [Amoebophrya sp. A120]|eukprot:GSA120T00018711001.1